MTNEEVILSNQNVIMHALAQIASASGKSRTLLLYAMERTDKQIEQIVRKEKS